MNLKVTIKDVGEKEVQADQVITPALPSRLHP